MKIYNERDKYQPQIDLCADQWWHYDRDCLDDWTKDCDKTYEHWDDVFEKSYKLTDQELKKIHSQLKVSTRNLQIVPPPEEYQQIQTVLNKAEQPRYHKSWSLVWDACNEKDKTTQSLCTRPNKTLNQNETYASSQITPSQVITRHSFNISHELPDEDCFTYSYLTTYSCYEQWKKFSDDCNEKFTDACDPAFQRFKKSQDEYYKDDNIYNHKYEPHHDHEHDHDHSMQRYEPLGLMLSDEQSPDVEQSFDWPTATIGASLGFIAGYTLMKAYRRKDIDDEFSRV